MLCLFHRRRPISLSLVLCFVAGLTSAFVHHGTEIHGYCSEHGEQIHLEHAQPGEHAGPRSGLEHQSGRTSGAHDCALLLFLTQGLELQRPTSAAAPGCRPASIVSSQQRHALAAISLLRQSPKTSPPCA